MCSERRDKLSISSEREEGGRSCTDVSRWRQWSPHHHLHLHHNIQHTRCTNQRHGHSSSTTTIYQVFRLFAATTTNTSRNISPSLERRQRQHSGSDSAVFSLCLSPLWRQRKIKLTLNNWWSWLSTQHHTQRRLLIFQEFENFSQFSLINLKTRYHFVILNIERIFMKILAHVWLVEYTFQNWSQIQLFSTRGDFIERVDIFFYFHKIFFFQFKRLLNKELSHFSESKSGNQISEYICNTFLGEYLYLVSED